MKRGLLSISLVIVLIVSLFIISCAPSVAPSPAPKPAPAPSPTPAPAQSIELKLDSPTTPPPTHTMSIAMASWIDMISQKTAGRVKITPFWANTLTPQNQKWDSCIKGMSQIAWVPTPELAGRFPLQQVTALALPGMKTGQSRSEAFYYLYDRFPELKAEYKDVHLLWVFSGPPNQLNTVKPVRQLSDAAGIKAWTAGRVEGQTLQKLGMTPVELAIPDVYTSLQTGVINGVYINADQLIIRKFAEIVKYTTLQDAACSANFAYIMNKDAWNSLPPDVQKVFDDLSGLWGSKFMSKAWDDAEAVAAQATKEKYNVEQITLAPDESAKWTEAVKPVALDYIKSLDDKGFPGTKMFNAITEFTSKSK
jgi:TRAP-type C4-dicarboxylate transport system substrate-binding protein